MKMIVPSHYQAIRFEINLKVVLDSAQEELRYHRVLEYPTSVLAEAGRKTQEMFTRQYISEYVNEWLDGVFANIVAEKK